ncbi:MAG: histidinol phosphate phosphatase domain-containing protein [Dehalococcoidia bacterium]|nr:histidinol phosphate phosphatase domain-containing protein [Dehalococcoidia bacterium]MDZ4246746.1 histidinol phosphate phosphatase domain-containing protein [Dehalococcoidia bacterium]
MVYDFHTHSFLSDGDLLPIELIRRALARGYKALAITDHAGAGNLENVIKTVSADCEMARKAWDFLAIPGVELTHVPANMVDELARTAKKMGAWVVVAHGESPVEPVEKGSNGAALSSRAVDILAHPGMLSTKDAALAAANGIFVEITARKGHCLTNGHVASLARRTGMKLLVNSDAHDCDDLLTGAAARAVAMGAGLGRNMSYQTLFINPKLLLQKLDLVLPDLHLSRWF